METFFALLALGGGIHRSSMVSLTKAADAEPWCFLSSAPEQTVEQTIDARVVWGAIVPFVKSL